MQGGIYAVRGTSLHLAPSDLRGYSWRVKKRLYRVPVGIAYAEQALVDVPKTYCFYSGFFPSGKMLYYRGGGREVGTCIRNHLILQPVC